MRRFRVFFAVVLATLLIGTFLPVNAEGKGPEAAGLRPDAPDYAKHGPFWVGTREATVPDKDGKRPLPLTVWYPALNPDGKPEVIGYSYQNFETITGFTGAGHALKDAKLDASKGPYPLAIISHAFLSYRYAYAYLAEHLASHGFVVMAADHTGNTLAIAADPKLAGKDFSGVVQGLVASWYLRPADIQREIDYAAVLNGKGGLLEGAIDTAKIAVIGHSSGAYTALVSAGAQVHMSDLRAWCTANANDKAVASGARFSFFCAMVVPFEEQTLKAGGINAKPGELWPTFPVSGVKAIVPISPGSVFGTDSFKNVTVPTLLMVGSLDSFGLGESTAKAYEILPSAQKGLVVFQNADHGFSPNACQSWFIEKKLDLCGADAVWDLNRAHDLVNHFTTAFLLDVLKGDKDAHKALLPDAVKFPGIDYKTTAK